MILDKSVEYLAQSVNTITQMVLSQISNQRDMSNLHRAMFSRFSANNFDNPVLHATLGLAIASIHNAVSQKSAAGVQFVFQDELMNGCQNAIQLMYYNHILTDGVISSIADQNSKQLAHQYGGNFGHMMNLARQIVSFDNRQLQQQPQFNVGYNNNGMGGMNNRMMNNGMSNQQQGFIIGNSNNSRSMMGSNNMPHLGMGGNRMVSDADVSDDLAMLGSTVKPIRRDPVIEQVVFSPAANNAFIPSQPQMLQQTATQQPAPAKSNALTLTFGDTEMDRSEHKLVIAGNEFVMPMHTCNILDRDASNAVAVSPKDDDVVSDSSIYLKILGETCNGLNDFISMVRSSHLEMIDDKGKTSMVARFIGTYFHVLPTKQDVSKYYEEIVNSNGTYHNCYDYMQRLSNRISKQKSDIDDSKKVDVLSLFLFVDNHLTTIVNDLLEFLFGKGVIDIDSFSNDWKDLCDVINTTYPDRLVEFFSITKEKFEAALMRGEETVLDNQPVYFTHMVNQYSAISVDVNSKHLGYECKDSWNMVDKLKHPMLHKLIGSCRSFVTLSGESSVKDMLVTSDLVVYEVAYRPNDASRWIRRLK